MYFQALLILGLKIFYQFCVYVHQFLWTIVYRSLRRPEEGIRSLELGLQVIVSCYGMEVLGIKTGPLQEQMC